MLSVVYTPYTRMDDFKYEGKDLEAMSFAKKYHVWILSEFKKFLGKRVAEVGAGSGSFSAILLGESIEELVAVEPSKEMYTRLVANTAEDTRVTSHNDFFVNVSRKYKNHFNAVVYVNVLEHVEDDASELSRIYESLRPGGHACIFVPALSWLYSAHDASIGHYRRYNKKQLCSCVSEAGFEIVHVRYFDILGVLPWFILMKLLDKNPGAGSVKLYDSCVVPISRVLESVIPPPIGKNLVIVGKRPA